MVGEDKGGRLEVGKVLENVQEKIVELSFKDRQNEHSESAKARKNERAQHSGRFVGRVGLVNAQG